MKAKKSKYANKVSPSKSVSSKNPLDSIATQKGGSPKSTSKMTSKKNC